MRFCLLGLGVGADGGLRPAGGGTQVGGEGLPWGLFVGTQSPHPPRL